jgi:hypothetical protein
MPSARCTTAITLIDRTVPVVAIMLGDGGGGTKLRPVAIEVSCATNDRSVRRPRSCMRSRCSWWRGYHVIVLKETNGDQSTNLAKS